jgi:HEAT repeat protein
MGETGTVAEAAIAGHVGDEARARELTASADPKVRAAAFGALARMGRASDADVRAALADPAAVVRHRALALAVHHPLVPIAHALDDDDPDVVEQAAWACGERLPPAPGVVERLALMATDHAEPLVREAAVAALGALGDPVALPAILAATTDKPAVRRRAVLALAPFDGPEVRTALERAREDRDWQVRQAAEDLLAIADGEGD